MRENVIGIDQNLQGAMNKFRTVAIFTYPAEAQVIKSKLESENVPVFLRNEYTIAAEPFASNALGGIKMEVYKEDFIKALGIIEVAAPEISQRVTANIACPNCGKRAVREMQDVNSATGVAETLQAALYSIIPFIKHKSYKCTNCALEFDLNE
jgi:DNA-directed RNA polymerase subunit RPC12/RpoP